MKLFIVCAGIEDDLQGWPDNRSLALQRVAGSNVLGHILNQMKGVESPGLTLLVDRDEAAISAWIAERPRGIPITVMPVVSGLNAWQALATCREEFDEESALVVFGNIINELDYRGLEQRTADVTVFLQPPLEYVPAAAAAPLEASDGLSWAGVCYFRQAIDLREALDDMVLDDTVNLPSLLAHLRKRDLRIDEEPATMSLDVSSIEGFHFANRRLLGLGYGSEDAIERSYVEDFTVMPPVFLHETAVIENSVVGPFANIEAGVKITNSVVSNSLIGQHSSVENAILDGSLIGEHARVQAVGNSVTVGNDAELILE